MDTEAPDAREPGVADLPPRALSRVVLSLVRAPPSGARRRAYTSRSARLSIRSSTLTTSGWNFVPFPSSRMEIARSRASVPR